MGEDADNLLRRNESIWESRPKNEHLEVASSSGAVGVEGDLGVASPERAPGSRVPRTSTWVTWEYFGFTVVAFLFVVKSGFTIDGGKYAADLVLGHLLYRSLALAMSRRSGLWQHPRPDHLVTAVSGLVVGFSVANVVLVAWCENGRYTAHRLGALLPTELVLPVVCYWQYWWLGCWGQSRVALRRDTVRWDAWPGSRIRYEVLTFLTAAHRSRHCAKCAVAATCVATFVALTQLCTFVLQPNSQPLWLWVAVNALSVLGAIPGGEPVTAGPTQDATERSGKVLSPTAIRTTGVSSARKDAPRPSVHRDQLVIPVLSCPDSPSAIVMSFCHRSEAIKISRHSASLEHMLPGLKLQYNYCGGIKPQLQKPAQEDVQRETSSARGPEEDYQHKTSSRRSGLSFPDLFAEKDGFSQLLAFFDMWRPDSRVSDLVRQTDEATRTMTIDPQQPMETPTMQTKLADGSSMSARTVEFVTHFKRDLERLCDFIDSCVFLHRNISPEFVNVLDSRMFRIVNDRQIFDGNSSKLAAFTCAIIGGILAAETPETCMPGPDTCKPGGSNIRVPVNSVLGLLLAGYLLCGRSTDNAFEQDSSNLDFMEVVRTKLAGNLVMVDAQDRPYDMEVLDKMVDDLSRSHSFEVVLWLLLERMAASSDTHILQCDTLASGDDATVTFYDASVILWEYRVETVRHDGHSCAARLKGIQAPYLQDRYASDISGMDIPWSLNQMLDRDARGMACPAAFLILCSDLVYSMKGCWAVNPAFGPISAVNVPVAWHSFWVHYRQVLSWLLSCKATFLFFSIVYQLLDEHAWIPSV